MFQHLRIGMEVRLDKSYSEMRAGDCLVGLHRGQKVTIVAEYAENDQYTDDQKCDGHHLFYVQWATGAACDADMKPVDVKWTALVRANAIDPNSF